MARSRTHTLLPLDRYAVLMGLNLYHFNNLDDGTQSGGNRAYWTQSDHDELALYLNGAENRLSNGDGDKLGLGFEIAPRFRQDRMLYFPQSTDWYEEDMLATPYGHIDAFGTQSLTVIAEDAEVVISDDTATITIADVSGVEVDEVVVFYRSDDGADGDADEAWQIRPLRVSLSGTTLTITGHTAQFVKPSVLEASTQADASTTSNYVAYVDVYQETVNEELPLTIEWDSYRIGASTDPTAKYTADGAALILDKDSGYFIPRCASYADSTHTIVYPTYSAAPRSILADYRAGYPYAVGSMRRIDSNLEVAAMRLANVMSPDFGHWVSDLADTKWRFDRKMPTQENPLQESELDNPFGYTNGARFAWSVVRRMRQTKIPF